MKKFNNQKLNNKGFTLIELLAVVVILAVVMGIAMTQVLSAMNKSRAGSLADSALVVANAFNVYSAILTENNDRYCAKGLGFDTIIKVSDTVFDKNETLRKDYVNLMNEIALSYEDFQTRLKDYLRQGGLRYNCSFLACSFRCRCITVFHQRGNSFLCGCIF